MTKANRRYRCARARVSQQLRALRHDYAASELSQADFADAVARTVRQGILMAGLSGSADFSRDDAETSFHRLLGELTGASPDEVVMLAQAGMDRVFRLARDERDLERMQDAAVRAVEKLQLRRAEAQQLNLVSS